LDYSATLKLFLLLFIFVASHSTKASELPTESYLKPQNESNPGHVTSHIIDDNYLILALNIQLIETEEIVESYTTPFGNYVSLEQLVDVLAFKISFDPNTHNGSGWFIKESFDFSLDYSTKTVTSRSKTIKLKDEDIIVHFNELYINTKAIPKILAIDVKLELAKLQLLIKSNHTLPIKAKYELLARQRKISGKKKKDEEKTLKSDYVSDKHQIMSIPEFQLNLKSQATDGTNQELHETFKENTQFSTILAHDLAWMSNNLFVYGDRREVKEIRTKAFRLSNRNDLLGPLKASQIYAGDLSEQAGTGAGVRIANDPIDQPNTFNKVIISGDSTPGWTVEIYSGKTLLDVVTIGDDGRYIFRDLKLGYKTNVFEVVEYGPHGEIKRKFHRYNLDRNFIKDDKLYYDFQVINDGQKLIDKARENTESDHINSLSLGKKIMDYLTLRVENENYTDSQKRYNQSYSLYTSLDSSLLRFKASTNKVNNGHTYLISSSQEEKIFGKSYIETTYGEGDTKTRSVDFDFERNLNFLFFNDTELKSENSITESDSESTYTANYKLSHIFPFLYFNTNFDITTNQETEITNRTVLNKKVGPFHNSLILNSTVEPTTQLTSVALNNNFAKKFYEDYQFSIAYTSTIPTEGNSTYNAKASIFRKIKKVFSYGVSANYERENEFSFSIDLSLNSNMSLFQEPLTKKPMVSTVYAIDKPLISVRSYIDNNDNNIFDQEDEIIEGVKYRFSSTYSNKPGNEDGITIGGNLSDGKIYDVMPDVSTIDDQTVIPKIESISAMPRTGNILALNFPFYRVGSIDGNLFFGKHPINRAKMILYNKKGEQVKSFITSEDGFFFFPDIPIGEYYIQLSDTSIQRIELASSPKFPIEITGEELYVEYLSYDVSKYAKEEGENTNAEETDTPTEQPEENDQDVTTTSLEGVSSTETPVIPTVETIIETSNETEETEPEIVAPDVNPAESLVTKEGFYEVELSSAKYKADLEVLNKLFKEQATYLFSDKNSTIKLIDPNDNKEIFYVLKIDNFFYQHNALNMCDEIKEEFDINCRVDMEMTFKKNFLSKENAKSFFEYIKECNSEEINEKDYHFVTKSTHPVKGIIYNMTLISYANSQENFDKICANVKQRETQCIVKPVIRLSESLDEENYKEKFNKISNLLAEYSVFAEESEYDASSPIDSELYKLRIGKFSDLNSAHDFCNKMLLNAEQCKPIRRIENTEQIEFKLD